MRQAHADELVLLAKAIHGHDMPGVFAEVRPHHLSGPATAGAIPLGAHAAVWGYIEDLRQGGTCNTEELVRAIVNDAEHCGPLSYWLGLPAPRVDLAVVVGRLLEADTRNKMIQDVRAVARLLDGETPIGDIMGMWDGLRQRLTTKPGNTPTDWLTGAEVLAAGHADVVRRMDAHHSGYDSGISTGYPTLDALLGPLEPDPYLLMARPGVGKTFLALGMLEHWCSALGLRVQVFSMEMDAAQLAKRLFGRSGVPGRGMMRGDLTRGQLAQLEHWQEQMQSWDWSLNPRPALRVQDIAAGVREAARRFGPPDIIVVDHVHLMRWDGNKSPNDGMAEISAGLKAITKEHGVPAMCLAQLNREVEKRQGGKPKMSDIRGSGAWEQDASGIIGLHREPPNPDKGHYGDLGEALVLKNRFGEVGTAPLVWDVANGGYVLGR